MIEKNNITIERTIGVAHQGGGTNFSFLLLMLGTCFHTKTCILFRRRSSFRNLHIKKQSDF